MLEALLYVLFARLSLPLSVSLSPVLSLSFVLSLFLSLSFFFSLFSSLFLFLPLSFSLALRCSLSLSLSLSLSMMRPTQCRPRQKFYAWVCCSVLQWNSWRSILSHLLSSRSSSLSFSRSPSRFLFLCLSLGERQRRVLYCCVAVCCSVLRWDFSETPPPGDAHVCCAVLQCVALCCSVLRCVAVCCAVLQCYVAVLRCHFWESPGDAPTIKRRSGMRCSAVLQCVAVCCSVTLRIITRRCIRTPMIKRRSGIRCSALPRVAH